MAKNNMRNHVKNVSASIYQKIRNLSKIRQRSTQELLRYYSMERFLYRLSVSSYKNKFFLKGGLMFLIWDHYNHRTTVDIDLLARCENKEANLKKIIKEITSQKVISDGIEFNISKLKLKKSQLETNYSGYRATFEANIFTAKLPIKIDFGFSDIILPKPMVLEYPILLKHPIFNIKGYTPETVVAEKLETIFRLGKTNSRMKDFYDIWVIFRQFKIDSEKLKKIIIEIFIHRNMDVSEYKPTVLFEILKFDKQTLERWKAFLIVIDHEHVAFERVLDFILKKLNKLSIEKSLSHI